jgi:hypothetical protein
MHIVNSEGKMVQSYGHIRISRARRFFRANSPQKKACAAQPHSGVRRPVKMFLPIYFLSAEHTLKIIRHTGKVPANDVHMIKSIIPPGRIISLYLKITANLFSNPIFARLRPELVHC